MKKVIFTAEEKNDIINKYNNGISTEKICLDYKVSASTIVKLLKANNIKIKGRFKNIDEKTLIKDYTNGMKNNDIFQKYNISLPKLLSVLSKYKIKNKGTKHYNVNENYFEIINTKEKAYWLGFLYADGYVRKKELRLKLKFSDKKHITKFKKELKSEHKIKDAVQKVKVNNKIYYSKCSSLSIYSIKLVDFLINKGCTNKKSKTLTFPKFLDQQLIPHFLRGVFDGDGSVSIGNDIYHSINFNIVSGSLPFLTDIKNEFMKLNIYDCVISKNKSNCWYINWYRQEDIKKLYYYLYKDANVYLERKKNKFEKILNI